MTKKLMNQLPRIATFTIAIVYFLIISTANAETAKVPQLSVDLKEIVTPIIQNEQIKAYATTRVTIEAGDQDQAKVLDKFIPRIRDKLIQELYIIMPLAWSDEGSPELEIIKPRLEKVISSSAPKDVIKNIFVRSIDYQVESKEPEVMKH